MKLKPHPESDRLAKNLDKCLALAVSQQLDVCRTSRPKYATIKKLLEGTGAKQSGGRWNPPGISAVYFSLDDDTALAEMRQRHRRGGVPLHRMMPRVFVAIRVRLERALDLTQKKVLLLLGVLPVQLCEEWQYKDDGDNESISQTIGRLAWERRLDGLLVPSVPGRPHNGVNLVVYPDHARPDWGEIYNKEELPPEGKGKPNS